MTAAAYLFDMDGTLVDTERFWSIGLVDMLRADGFDLPYADASSIIWGRSWNSVYADVVSRFPAEGVYSNDDLADRLKPYYLHAREGADLSIPGSAEAFRALSRRAPCAIVSGSRREDVEETVAALGLTDCLSLLIGAQDCPVGKPAPDGFLMAARGLGVEPADCVVIEDSNAGVRAGKAAGMRVVALVRPDAPDQGVRGIADLCVPNLMDVLRSNRT